jgi:hypothetical protein
LTRPNPVPKLAERQNRIGYDSPESAMTAERRGFSFWRKAMPLSDRLRDAMVWLGEPAAPEHVVTEETLRQLAAEGIVEYGRDGTVRFTEAGAQVYRDTVGHLPTRNI